MSLTEKLKNALKHREPLLASTNALRLVNGLGDGIPGITADLFNRHILMQLYQEPLAIDPLAVADFLQRQLSPSYMIVKNRTLPPQECLATAKVLAAQENSRTTVKEHGFTFQVDLQSAVNPGLFLDMRANRLLVGQNARNRTILNCFAYTCAFGVFCSGQGARRVVNVDISRKTLDWGRLNYALNSLSAKQEDFIYSDTAAYLAGACKWHNFFDVIILDPPTFSRYQGKVFSVQKHLPGLMESAVQILNPGGDLFVSTNCSDLQTQDLETWIHQIGVKKNRKILRCQQLGQDLDFRGSGSMKESHLAAIWVRMK